MAYFAIYSLERNNFAPAADRCAYFSRDDALVLSAFGDLPIYCVGLALACRDYRRHRV